MHLALYNFIGYLLLPVMVLRLLLKSLKTTAYRQRIGERLGLIKPITTDVIWVHCVSMGEFRAAIVLIDALIESYPNYKILITSTTPTGSEEIRKHYHNKVLHYYFPFDVFFIVKRYVKKVQPALCILLETEVWPNLIHTLRKNNIPSLIANARLSDKSFKKYQKFPKFTCQILNELSCLLTQDEQSKNRFIQLGIQANKAHTIGNIKFDFAVQKSVKIPALQNIKQKIVLCASTHKGEEKQLLDAYIRVKNTLNTLLVIVPRHPDRFEQVFTLIKSYQLRVCKRSSGLIKADCEVLLGDSMGEMMGYFNAADIVFMGGSFSNTGGHNILEPAALAKPILFGPNMFNFAQISADLLKQNAAIQVQNADILFAKITTLLNDKAQINTLSNNAMQYFHSKQGALNNLMEYIDKFCTIKPYKHIDINNTRNKSNL